MLVAGAEEGLCASLRLLLEPRFRVFAAESGEQAVEIVRREDPDVVILDLELPGVGGTEALARIRDLSPGAEVIVVGGAGSHDEALAVLSLRAFDYLTKPIQERPIVEIVEWAERSRERQLRAETEEDPAHLIWLLIDSSSSTIKRFVLPADGPDFRGGI